MQSVSSRIWIRIAVFISYGDNDYILDFIWYTLQKYFITSKTLVKQLFLEVSAN